MTVGTTVRTTGTTTTDIAAPSGGARPSRSGVSVRVRITAAVALLVASTLAGAGLLVYVIELRRLDANTVREVDQEFGEFQNLSNGRDPVDGEQWDDVGRLLTVFIQRNVPDDDEQLVGWFDDGPARVSQGAEDRRTDEPFLEAARTLVDAPGERRIETADGELLISSQTVTINGQDGALLVLNYLEEDRDEIRSTMRTYAIVATLSLFLIVLIAFWQAGRLLAPLRVVRRTADEITETDLSQRLPVSGNDDITALTRTFNGMLDRLEAAFTGQRQLLDDAGHELRTPLTILQGHLELLDADDPDEVAETREMLLDEVDRMARLVDDLILLAKTERPGFLDLAEVDVAALTEGALAKASALGDRDWSADSVARVRVPADAQRITQALLQLAHNAVKHTGPGDQIAFGSTYDGDAVLWWVRDTGPGVPDADRERIFERFGRAESTDTEGFGLGLSIVTAIARAHGGDAWLDVVYRDGARFVFSVPVQPTQVPPPAGDTRVLPRPQLPAPPRGGQPTDQPTDQPVDQEV